MFIFSEDDTVAINMEQVAFIRLVGGSGGVGVVATIAPDGEDILLKTCDSGGEARDWLNALLTSYNAHEGGKIYK